MNKAVCKHFRGIQNQVCGADIDIRALVGGEQKGWAIRTPCLKSHKADITCESYAEPTRAELAADAAEWDKVIKRITIVTPVVNEWRNKEPIGKSAIIECPACQGKLHLAQAACNGHVHGKCETDGCVSWME